MCVRCGKDWTPDLDNIADAPGATLDALCECQQFIVAEGADPGIHIIEGLIEDDDPALGPDAGQDGQ